MRTKENAQNDSKGCSADLGEQEDLHCWGNWLVILHLVYWNERMKEEEQQDSTEVFL